MDGLTVKASVRPAIFKNIPLQRTVSQHTVRVAAPTCQTSLTLTRICKLANLHPKLNTACHKRKSGRE